MDITGAADGPPMRIGIAMTDYLAGFYAFGGILLALRDRDRTGDGQHVDIALFDSVLSTLSMPAGILQATGRGPRRMGNDHPSIAPYETLRAKDGMVMIAAANRGCGSSSARLDRGQLAEDPRFATNTDRVKNRAALKAELEGRLPPFGVDELARRWRRGVPCGRVRTVAEAVRIRRSRRGRCSSRSTTRISATSASSATRSSSRTTRTTRIDALAAAARGHMQGDLCGRSERKRRS